MSGRGGFANGYGYSDAGGYDRSDGGYGSLGANGYGSSRSGGYGGFGYESPQQTSILPPTQSPERHRDRMDRGRQPPSSSRSRTREGDMLHPTRDGRSPGDTSFYSGKSRERGRSEVSDAPGTQAVEGMNILLGFMMLAWIWTANWLFNLFQMYCDRSNMNGTSCLPTIAYQCRWL